MLTLDCENWISMASHLHLSAPAENGMLSILVLDQHEEWNSAIRHVHLRAIY
jgi:hypothetical protein